MTEENCCANCKYSHMGIGAIICNIKERVYVHRNGICEEYEKRGLWRENEIKKLQISDTIFGNSRRWGKVVLQEQKWENLNCTDCGGRLKIEKDNEFESVKVCQDCGSRAILIKKIRKLKGELRKNEN